MRVEELRIGNLVMFDNRSVRHPQQRIVKVKEITEKKIVVSDIGLDLVLFLETDYVKPIPETLEPITVETSIKGYRKRSFRDRNIIPRSCAITLAHEVEQRLKGEGEELRKQIAHIQCPKC